MRLAGEDVTGLPPHQLARRGLSRTFQNLQIFFRMTALENVMVGRHLHENRNVLAASASSALGRPAEPDDPRHGRWQLLALVGLAAAADRPAGSAPLRRAQAARDRARARDRAEGRSCSTSRPPAAIAVETEEIDAVIRGSRRDGVTVVLVEHDMRLVMKISDRIHVLDQGRTLAEGTAAEVRANPAVIAAYLGVRGAREAGRAVG